MKTIIITNLDYYLKNGFTYFELATLEREIIDSKEIKKRIISNSGYFNLVIASVYPNGDLEYSYKFELKPF